MPLRARVKKAVLDFVLTPEAPKPNNDRTTPPQAAAEPPREPSEHLNRAITAAADAKNAWADYVTYGGGLPSPDQALAAIDQARAALSEAETTIRTRAGGRHA